MFRPTGARGVEASGQAESTQDVPGKTCGLGGDNTLQDELPGRYRAQQTQHRHGTEQVKSTEVVPGVVTLHHGSVRCANDFAAKWALGLTTKLIHATAG